MSSPITSYNEFDLLPTINKISTEGDMPAIFAQASGITHMRYDWVYENINHEWERVLTTTTLAGKKVRLVSRIRDVNGVAEIPSVSVNSAKYMFLYANDRDWAPLCSDTYLYDGAGVRVAFDPATPTHAELTSIMDIIHRKVSLDDTGSNYVQLK